MHHSTWKRNKKNRFLNSICRRSLLICCLLSLLALILFGTNAILVVLIIMPTSTTITTTTTTTTTTAVSCSASGSTTQILGGTGGASVLYTFDNTPNDYFGNYDAVPVNSPQYVSPGYNGRGHAIQLRQNLSQHLTIANHMNFYQRSLTVEAWIYPLTICNLYNIVSFIFAQINSSVLGQYMWFGVRNGMTYGSFYYSDVPGSTMIGVNQWHHIAFTYKYMTLTQIVYVDGAIDGIHTSASPCLITSGLQTIGSYRKSDGSIYGYFDGYIDQLAILFNIAKSPDEILDDATLVAHYSMDCLSYSSLDSGPNQINGVAVGVSSGDGGRVGQSYLFNTNSSYFQVTGLVLLGQFYRPFSFAMWLRPTLPVTNAGTILHVSEFVNGTGWCVQFVGLSSLGQIIVRVPSQNGTIEIVGPILIADQWIHIVQTYSKQHGICLYVNGVLYKQTTAFIYAASGFPMTVTLGQPLNGGSCDKGGIQSGFYHGQIDEFYIYSRELSQTDITALANP